MRRWTDHGAPASGTYCILHARHGWATEVKFLMSRADQNRKTLCCSKMFSLCRFRALSSGCTSCRWGSAGLAREGRHLLVPDAQAEQVVSLVVDWRPTYCPLFIQGKSMNMCELARACFFFPLFSIEFCSVSASLRFSEAPRKFESQMPPLSSLFTNMFHLKLTFWRSTMNCLPRCLLVTVM